MGLELDNRRAEWVHTRYCRKPHTWKQGSHIALYEDDVSLCGENVVKYEVAHPSEKTCKDCSTEIQKIVKEAIPE